MIKRSVRASKTGSAWSTFRRLLNCQEDDLQCGQITRGELVPLGCLADDTVEGFDRVGRVSHLANRRRVLKQGGQVVPVPVPGGMYFSQVIDLGEHEGLTTLDFDVDLPPGTDI